MTEKIVRLRSNYPNLSGLISVLLWSTGATSLCFIDSIPPFQLLGMVFLGVFAFTICKLIYTKEWKKLKMPLKHWLLVGLGLPLQQILYLLAYKNCPPEEADILIYTWPLMSLLFLFFGFKQRLTKFQIAGGALGFMAIVVISFGNSSNGLQLGFGHLAALFTAFTWSLFTILSKKGPPIGIDNVGISYGFGFLALLPLHLAFESFSIPSAIDAFGIFYYSVFIATVPFILWAYSTQRGNVVLLATSAYFKPLLSIILLICAGFAEFKASIGIASTLVIAGGLLSNKSFTDWLEDQFANNPVPITLGN